MKHFSGEKFRKSNPRDTLHKSGLSVVVDVETTGLNPEKERIIEIAAIAVTNGQIDGTFHLLVNPERNIPRVVEKLTGIRDADVKDAPAAQAALAEFGKFITAHTSTKNTTTRIIGHNVAFDLAFIHAELHRVGPITAPRQDIRSQFAGSHSSELKRANHLPTHGNDSVKFSNPQSCPDNQPNPANHIPLRRHPGTTNLTFHGQLKDDNVLSSHTDGESIHKLNTCLENCHAVCTAHLARRLIEREQVGRYRLANVARYLNTTHKPSHRALDDVYTTYEVFQALIQLENPLA
ncbi:3'-5' exonuclease [Corynebacterium anserum]|uniref:3'-5' exonuclease n=1 Tax=Corynebacterium anserum TaxID=2684406 RepID=UPI0016403571|nr:3'-5' exonuclease [Corynebacterium anserum]